MSYSSPFKERTFFERYAASFKFQAQNFKVLSTLYLVFIIPVCYILTNSNIEPVGTILVSILGLCTSTYHFATFKQYIKRKGAATLNKDFFNDCKSVLKNTIILSLAIGIAYFFIVIALALFIVFLSAFLNIYVITALLLFAILLIAVAFYIPATHYIISSHTAFTDITDKIKEGFKLQKGHYPGILGYCFFCGFIYIILELFAIVFPLVFCIIKYGEDYTPGSTYVFFVIVTVQFLNYTFLFIPMLYQYGYVIAKNATQEKENSQTMPIESPTQEAQAAENHTEESTEPTAAPTIEATENTPQTEATTGDNDAPTATREGTFRIEGNGTYSIELYSIKESQQMAENLHTLLGYSEAEAQNIVNNLPTTIAEKLSMSEALDLRTLIEQAGGSVNIK